MKKYFLSAIILLFVNSKVSACGWYEADYAYFNLFTQTIIKDKSYLPFLHTLENRFYGHEHFEIPSENIEEWQKFFHTTLTYSETQKLVESMSMQELDNF